MSVETVNVLVQNDFPLGTPVPGVVVRIFDSTGTNFVTSAVSDVNGQASFSLPADVPYQVRFFLTRFSIQQPVLITPVSAPVAPVTNDFMAVGHVYSPPEAVSLRMCRCSGFFINLDGSPAIEHAVHIVSVFDPLTVDGNAMLTERLIQHTDHTGYVQFDLVRNGQYEVTVEGLEDQVRIITVPDAAAMNLPDMMFAVVDHVTFAPPGPWSLSSGQRMLVTPTVYTSDGRVLPGIAPADVLWSTDDSSVALVCYAGTQLEFRGGRPGTASLLCVRKDNSIIRIPNPPIGGLPQSIVVS